MKESLWDLIKRKLKAVLLATLVSSMGWTFWEINTNNELIHHLGTHFYSMTWTYFFYIGLFVLTYGILVSFIIESFQQNWFKQADWLYILILGIFGSAIGLLFPAPVFIIAGILVASIYGVIDKWLLKRWQQNQGNKALFLVPLFAYLIVGGFFLFTSPTMPPVTAEDAVEFATYDNGTKTDDFPNKAGTWKGTVDGYEVKRKTAVEKMEENIYLVIFTESWQKGTGKGTWMTSYEVDRGSITLYEQGGNMAPYDTLNEMK